MLTDIPEGATCYLDATIFSYHLVETPALSDDCSDVLMQIELGRVHGLTFSVALAEVTYKVMLAEVVSRHGVAHQGLIARLKRHPALLDGLTSHHPCEKICDRLYVDERSRRRRCLAVRQCVRTRRRIVSEICVVTVLAEREHIMAETVQDASPPFIEVGYTAKVAFTQAHAPERLDLRTLWQQSQGSWRHHPVFHGLPIHEVILWLRGEDSDV